MKKFLNGTKARLLAELTTQLTLPWRGFAGRRWLFPPWKVPRTRSCTSPWSSVTPLCLYLQATILGQRTLGTEGRFSPLTARGLKIAQTGWKQRGPTHATPHRQVNPGAQTPIMSGKSRRGGGRGGGNPIITHGLQRRPLDFGSSALGRSIQNRRTAAAELLNKDQKLQEFWGGWFLSCFLQDFEKLGSTLESWWHPAAPSSTSPTTHWTGCLSFASATTMTSRFKAWVGVSRWMLIPILSILNHFLDT